MKAISDRIGKLVTKWMAADDLIISNRVMSPNLPNTRLFFDPRPHHNHAKHDKDG